MKGVGASKVLWIVGTLLLVAFIVALVAAWLSGTLNRVGEGLKKMLCDMLNFFASKLSLGLVPEIC